MHMKKILAMSTIALSAVLVAAPSVAQEAKAETKAAVKSTDKKERTLTTVYGKDGKVLLELTESSLEKFKKDGFKATAPWYKQTHQFDGISFADVLTKAGVSAKETLVVVAWDKYKIEMPASDVFETNVILATHIDGKRFELKDKGPFFIMYPMDDKPKYKDPTYFNRSVWQIKEIRVK